MTRKQIRRALNKVISQYPFTSRSDVVRVEAASLIEACYIADHISRDEYFELLGALV